MTQWHEMALMWMLDSRKAATEFEMAGALWGMQHRTGTNGCLSSLETLRFGVKLSKPLCCYSKCKTKTPCAFTLIYQTASHGGVSINSLTCLRLSRTNGDHAHLGRQKMCFILVSFLRWESRLRCCSAELLCGAAPLVPWRDNVLTNCPQIDQIRTHSTYFPLRWLTGILQLYGMDKGLCSVTARSAWWIRHPLIWKITLRLRSLSGEKHK